MSQPPPSDRPPGPPYGEPPPAAAEPPVPAAAASPPGVDGAGGWGAGRTLGGLAVFLVLVGIEAAVVAAFDPEIETVAARLALQTMLAATLIGVAFVVASPGGRPVAPPWLGLRRPLHPAIKLSVLAYLAYIGCALVIAALIEPEQEDITRDLGYGEGGLADIGAALLIIAAAPISEEIFFRGFMFTGLRRSAPFAVAALVSAAIWGLFHYTGPGSWGVVLQLTVFGVALAWLYERTGSLWPAIAIHAFNNALAFAVLTS